MILTLLNLLKLVLLLKYNLCYWKTPCDLEKNAYSVFVGRNIVEISNSSLYLLVLFSSSMVLMIFLTFLINSWDNVLKPLIMFLELSVSPFIFVKFLHIFYISIIYKFCYNCSVFLMIWHFKQLGLILFISGDDLCFKVIFPDINITTQVFTRNLFFYPLISIYILFKCYFVGKHEISSF